MKKSNNGSNSNSRSGAGGLKVNQDLAVLNQGLDKLENSNHPKRGKKNNNNIQKSDLSYTGFTAKFTNLSPNEVHLYWDSRTKPKFVSTILPFESTTTVTFPGNSFHVTPTYDTENALQRWTITNDE